MTKMGAFGEQGSVQEQGVAYARRSKSGLETPLMGRFYGENKFLVFAPPIWYDVLVAMCIVGGALFALSFWRQGGDPVVFWASLAVSIAGVWAAVSNERFICDLRSRTYVRYEGRGFTGGVTKGSLNELDALVLTSEQYLHGSGVRAVVIYRLIVYWKEMRQPLLVVERERKSISYGSPLNVAAGAILQRGGRYASAIQVKFYDNSHLSGHAPVRPI